MPIRREFITMFFSLITVVFILSVSFPLVRGDVRVLNRQRFKYVVQVNEVIVSPNNPVSTKSSIQSPEQPNTVKEEVSPVKEETTLVDPDKPHLLKHIGFTYPAFVLPPPLYVSDKVPRLEDVNQYFRSLKQVSASCKEDICVHPKSYLSRYSTVDCNKTPNACEESRILVMQEPKYLVGNLDIIANGSVDRHLDCGWPADHTKSLVPRPYHDDFIYPETVVVLVVPQGLSFQHFMDGVVPKLVQLQEVIPQEPNALYVMDKSFLDPMPLKLLARLGIRESQIRDPSEMNYRNGYLRAKKLVLACQVPPLHPQLWRDDRSCSVCRGWSRGGVSSVISCCISRAARGRAMRVATWSMRASCWRRFDRSWRRRSTSLWFSTATNMERSMRCSSSLRMWM